MSKRLEDKARRTWQAARFASTGIEMGVSVAIGYYGGAWLGRRLQVEPWGGVVGLLIGFTAGLLSLFQAGRRATRDEPPDA